MVRFGFRVPSLKKRISSRTSVKRYVRNNLGLKAPRGWGWLTNPKKAAYNRVYNRTTRGCMVMLVWLPFAIGMVVAAPALVRKTRTFIAAVAVTNDSFQQAIRGRSSYGNKQGPKDQSREATAEEAIRHEGFGCHPSSGEASEL